MNLEEAQQILTLKAVEKDVKRNFRDYDERMKFLQKWVKRYGDELAVVKHHHAGARERVKRLPTLEQVKEAERVCSEVESVDKEIKKLKKRKEKYRDKRKVQ